MILIFPSKTWKKILKKHRAKTNMSLVKLSNLTGISKNTLINIEKGDTTIQFKTLEKLEIYFAPQIMFEELESISKMYGKKPEIKDSYYKEGADSNVLYLKNCLPKMAEEK
jgi:DNA-binding XRE family transcriptional regulator